MIVFVTNSLLCKDDFYERVEKLCKSKPDILILREKELKVEKYKELAIKVKKIAIKYGVDLYINSRIEVARELSIKNLQLSYGDYFKYKEILEDFDNIIVSIHSKDELESLQYHKINFLIVGHIFETSSKKGLKSRGLEFLYEICKISQIPILAIGGIDRNRYKQVLESGAKGFCIMSETMLCKNPETLCKEYILNKEIK